MGGQGGLLQLVAQGKQDVFLTGNSTKPLKSFFISDIAKPGLKPYKSLKNYFNAAIN